MKKRIILTFILLFFLLALIFLLPYLKTKFQISKLQPYYKDLAEKCKSSSCCLSSVQSMSAGNYQLMPESGCPSGSKKNGLRCEDSYAWCEPA